MVAGALKKVGVEAVVEGLGQFISNIGKMNSSIASVGAEGNILTRTLGGVSNAFGWLGDKIIDVATYALGQLLARAIELVVSKLAELISATIQAASEFQIMELRLNRLNFNDLLNSTGSYTAAMEGASAITQEQLSWVRKLAVTTPFDATDISNVFTLARSYGFASEEAKGLTEDISDFAAGMGLGSTEIERIIVNFGQMVQQGKVTQREMNDLARGAFVPVNDILKQMQENTGLTGAAFDKFKTSGEGVNAFMAAFSQIVQGRFQGAAADMARTFQGATANAQDLLSSLIGFNIVLPILNTLGSALASLVDSFSSGGNFEALSLSASRLGQAISDLITDLLGLENLNTVGITQGILQAFNRLTAWINDNRGEIVGFFKSIGSTITTQVIPFIQRLVDGFNSLRDWLSANRGQFEFFFTNLGRIMQNTIVAFIIDKVIPAFEQISDWVSDHSALIQEFFLTVGQIIGDVFNNLTGNLDTEGGIESILQGVQAFMQYVIDNQESITAFVTELTKLWVIFQVITFVIGILVGVLAPLVAAFVFFVGLITSFIAVFGVIPIIVALIIGVFANMVIWILALGEVFLGFAQGVLPAVVAFFTVFIATMITKFFEMRNKFIEIVNQLKSKLMSMVSDFVTVGKNLIQGLIDGAGSMAGALVAAMMDIVEKALDAIMKTLGISSPSKEGFFIGEMTMQGMVDGITKNASALKDAMLGAVDTMMTPTLAIPAMTQQYAVALPGTVNSTNNYTNNWNLTVNSNSPVEPVVQDYQMLRSLSGA